MRLAALLVAIAFASVADARPPKVPPKQPAGYLTLDSQPFAVIYIDGKRYGETPLVKLPLTPGRHILRAVRDNGDAQRLTIDIDVGKTFSHRLQWDAQAPSDSSGYLVLSSVPAASVWVDGIDTGKTTPVTGYSLPVKPGRHKVSFVVGADKWTFAVTVQAGETAMLAKQLQ